MKKVSLILMVALMLSGLVGEAQEGEFTVSGTNGIDIKNPKNVPAYIVIYKYKGTWTFNHRGGPGAYVNIKGIPFKDKTNFYLPDNNLGEMIAFDGANYRQFHVYKYCGVLSTNLQGCNTWYYYVCNIAMLIAPGQTVKLLMNDLKNGTGDNGGQVSIKVKWETEPKSNRVSLLRDAPASVFNGLQY